MGWQWISWGLPSPLTGALPAAKAPPAGEATEARTCCNETCRWRAASGPLPWRRQPSAGLPNGEAEGAKAHPEAKAEYDAFLNEQAEHPTGGK